MFKFFDDLKNLINMHDDVILMTHARPDLDGMISALALARYVSSLGKECNVVAPKELNNSSLNKALNFINDGYLPFKYEESFDRSKNSLLIVLDTQKKDLAECPLLLDSYDTIVIDHHLTDFNKISSILEFCDSSKSSTVEIICEFLIYNDFKLDKFFYSALLAGMDVDTNGFNLRVSLRTFEIAGYLVQLGADLIVKQEILKKSMACTFKRYDYIKKSLEVLPHVFVCVCDDIFYNYELAGLAEEILKFEGVKVSFAIGRLSSSTIGVSARSMGDINVGKIMIKMGGGGHLANAAAQVKDKDLSDVFNLLSDILKEDLYESNIIE